MKGLIKKSLLISAVVVGSQAVAMEDMGILGVMGYYTPEATEVVSPSVSVAATSWLTSAINYVKSLERPTLPKFSMPKVNFERIKSYMPNMPKVSMPALPAFAMPSLQECKEYAINNPGKTSAYVAAGVATTAAVSYGAYKLYKKLTTKKSVQA